MNTYLKKSLAASNPLYLHLDNILKKSRQHLVFSYNFINYCVKSNILSLILPHFSLIKTLSSVVPQN